MAKRAAILESALNAFLKHGFNAASIEQIAADAGVSKVTIYNRFSAKETLFEAVVKQQSEQIAAAVTPDVLAQGDFETQLNAYGVGLLTFLFASGHVALDRMIPQEIAHQPKLARRFFDSGPGQSRVCLAKMLEEGRARGQVSFDNAMDAAEDLAALWKGLMDVELKFGVRSGLSPEEIEKRVKRGTQVFLRAYRP